MSNGKTLQFKTQYEFFRFFSSGSFNRMGSEGVAFKGMFGLPGVTYFEVLPPEVVELN